ncbi:unnamed protein product [Ambrosiozyma monospora]|uniref:Unnamed protein product n=1 Tax=Ambrosiozyma monospora TaxID=43982 RepID=A0A9W6T3C4_AMBMO|nr:unnamed protein product [Ambrosiozyma monospora]
MEKIGVAISKDTFMNHDEERSESDYGSELQLELDLESSRPECEPESPTAPFNSHANAIANPTPVEELEKWGTERQRYEPNEDMIIGQYSQDNGYPFVSMNAKQPIFTHDTKNEFETRTFLMETAMLNLLDKEASLKYENVLLNYMKTDPKFVKTNDLDVVRAYIYDKYGYSEFTSDAKKNGSGYGYDEEDISHCGDDSAVEKEQDENQPQEEDCETELIPLCYRLNAEKFYEPIYFSEDNMFFIPEFDEITNDMIVDMSYEYSSY